MSTFTKWVVNEEPPDVIVYVDSATDEPRVKYIDRRMLVKASELLASSLNLIESMMSGEFDSEDAYNEFQELLYEAKEQGLISV